MYDFNLTVLFTVSSAFLVVFGILFSIKHTIALVKKDLEK